MPLFRPVSAQGFIYDPLLGYSPTLLSRFSWSLKNKQSWVVRDFYFFLKGMVTPEEKVERRKLMVFCFGAAF